MIKNSIIESHDLELLKDREIQGLYSFKNSCQSFWSLKAKVDLASFQTQEKVGSEGRAKQSKKSRLILCYCRDCGTPKETGSPIWFECPVDRRWRTSMDTCVYPTKRVNEN